MSNIDRLKQHDANRRIFANTIIDLHNSQGFYSRLYEQINEMPEETFKELCNLLDRQSFRDPVDVVLWLEA